MAVGLVGLLWAATLSLTRPADSPTQSGHRRFELVLGEARAGRPGAVDYARLDARLQQLMEDPSMVGLAVAVVEDGQI
ncbi:MAG: hypothetical protein ACXWUP_10435, partial [Allosphingosinicella sp.]